VRRAVLALILLTACSSQKAAAPPGNGITSTAITSPASGVTVVAAGDIACPLSLACHDTAGLVEALKPDAVLALGDLQYERGELADFEAVYDKAWGRFKSITHPVPGNHEYASAGAAGYFAYWNVKPWYSVDIGGWHVVALNSNCRSVGGCGPGSPQERWLKADLAAHPATCTLAFWHHPRWSSGYNGSDPGYDPFWADLAAAGADVVLSGHDHDYERFAPDRGIRQFVAGTGGRSVYPVLNHEAGSEVINDASYGVLELTLQPKGYSWNFVPLGDSKFRDSGHADCS
jgi:3',5'-cyclic AMP phosphodiesterase CpdA